MPQKFLIATAVTAGLYTSAAFAGAVPSFTSVKDNTLFEDPSGLVSNGAGPTMFAGANGQASIRRALVAFDLSSIPAGATVTSASLNINVTKNHPGSYAFDIHRMLADWGESDSNSGTSGQGVDAHPGDVTWNFRFFGNPAHRIPPTAPGAPFRSSGFHR